MFQKSRNDIASLLSHFSNCSISMHVRTITSVECFFVQPMVIAKSSEISNQLLLIRYYMRSVHLKRNQIY